MLCTFGVRVANLAHDVWHRCIRLAWIVFGRQTDRVDWWLFVPLNRRGCCTVHWWTRTSYSVTPIMYQSLDSCAHRLWSAMRSVSFCADNTAPFQIPRPATPSGSSRCWPGYSSRSKQISASMMAVVWCAFRCGKDTTAQIAKLNSNSLVIVPGSATKPVWPAETTSGWIHSLWLGDFWDFE